ncbi:MAG: PfkB family carbohydrate kinase [Rhizobiaceae bacterium]
MNAPPHANFSSPAPTGPGPSRPGSPRVVVVGAAHIDRTGWLSAPSALGCSNPGRFEEMPGGTALNIARVAAQLCGDVDLISLVGNDAAAEQLRQELIAHGITAHLAGGGGGGGGETANTGTYTSIIEPDGSLLVALADMAIYENFSAAPVKPFFADLSPHDWLCVDTNLPPPQIDQLLAASRAAKVGVTVSKAKAPNLLVYASQLDLIFTNRVEACSLCGIEPGHDVTIADMANGLRQICPASFVISNGPDSVTVLEGDSVTSISVSALSADRQVTDVTGAGDALVGASLFALTHGANLVNAVQYGIEAARATIQVKGAICPDLAKRIGPFEHQSQV